MRQNNTTKVLEVFYESPNRSFSIRDISKLTRVPRATTHKILKELKKESLITKENKAKDSLIFKTKKVNYFIEMIITSGLIEEIISQLNPSCIILFGSFRKGESIKESDIDLFVESSIKKEISLKEYEKKLKHKIHLLIESKMKNLQLNLFNNVVNGIKLYGAFNVK